jgi:transposase
MPARFVNIDHDTPLLLPPNIREWVPRNHLAHYILDAVEELDLRQVRVNHRGTGSEQFPPGMMTGLLIYCYATGTFSSRQIERATHENVAVRMLCADTHPDHDTICAFRRENQPLLAECFVKVLQMAQQLKLLKVGQITVSVDGTKVLAHASKHAAVSYQRAGQQIEMLEAEVRQLLAKAEAADSTPLEEGLSIPQEITRRQERKAALAKARAEIEARAAARAVLERAEYERKLAERAARRERGERVGGRPPQPPSAVPEPGEQYNFTDPPSRIMKAGSGQHFEQSYNAQAAVEVESRLIVMGRVSDAPNDKQQLPEDLKAVPAAVGSLAAVLADNGFYSEAAVEAVERTAKGEPTGVTVYAAVEKTGHHRSVADLEARAEPEPPPSGASVGEVMRYRLRTRAGRALYKLRQQTVEPVFGILKEVMGFRRFLLRGLEKVNLEWTLVCLAYNFKRLHRLATAG